MELASMTDQESLISKLRSNIVRKRLNTMIWHASITRKPASVASQTTSKLQHTTPI